MNYSKNKKGSKEFGLGIISFALLMLLVGIFQSNPIGVNSINDNQENTNFENNSDYPEKNYLFYLEDFDLGQQKKTTQSFPNIELGSSEEYITTFIESRILLRDNMFSSEIYSIPYSVENPEEFKELLIYANVEQLSGSNEIEVYSNEKLVATIPAKSKYFPIRMRNIDTSKNTQISLRIKNVPFYNPFSWNKIEFTDFRIVEVRKSENENTKSFSFEVNEEHLGNVSVNLVISCETTKEKSENIEVKVNDYILTNQNPQCLSKYNRIGVLVPTNILKYDEPNQLTLNTQGHYKLAYSITSTAFNDQEKYMFVVNSFTDVFDIVMHGDFDKDSLLIKINNKRLELKRGDYVSILPYTRFGSNEIEFLNKPFSMDEFIIEKIDYYSEGYDQYN